MLGRIVGLVCCMLCAWPFFIVGYYNKNSKEPINFWSGDKKLKEKVKDVSGYNAEISNLYTKCALVLALTGVCCLVHLGMGICFLLLECTLGIYIVWKLYKSILEKYS